jgi:hypothetical protein
MLLLKNPLSRSTSGLLALSFVIAPAVAHAQAAQDEQRFAAASSAVRARW